MIVVCVKFDPVTVACASSKRALKDRGCYCPIVHALNGQILWH
jgi:hypothetical protein